MDLLERLHRRLLAALSDAPGPADLTIADLYQRLIPYRSVRADLGVMELAEYEHLLLRLLSGEGNHLRLANEEIETEFRRELASSSPILGIYRDYAAATIAEVAQAAPRPGGREGTERVRGAAAPARASVGEEALTPRSAAGERIAHTRPDRRPPADRAPASTAPPAASAQHRRMRSDPSVPPFDESSLVRCRRCSRELPSIAVLRFCPFCGLDQPIDPCAQCGEPFQPSWRYCVRCGTGRSP